jgi:transcriptional regulator with XRE-family HTH domain
LLNKELADLLTQFCKDKGLSFRSLSINSGLSPGTVHNIVKGKYKPNIATLNALADYLGLKREYLWQVAGLLDDMEYGSESSFNDPQVRFHFAQVDGLPREKRNIILRVVETMLMSLKAEDIPYTRTKGALAVAEKGKGRCNYKVQSS